MHINDVCVNTTDTYAQRGIRLTARLLDHLTQGFGIRFDLGHDDSPEGCVYRGTLDYAGASEVLEHVFRARKVELGTSTSAPVGDMTRMRHAAAILCSLADWKTLQIERRSGAWEDTTMLPNEECADVILAAIFRLGRKYRVKPEILALTEEEAQVLVGCVLYLPPSYRRLVVGVSGEIVRSLDSDNEKCSHTLIELARQGWHYYPPGAPGAIKPCFKIPTDAVTTESQAIKAESEKR